MQVDQRRATVLRDAVLGATDVGIDVDVDIGVAADMVFI
jgi:hypothetical protein